MGTPVATSLNTRARIMAEPEELPPFSPTLTRLLEMLPNKTAPLGEVAAIIETDAVLSGSLLRLANSPAEGCPATVYSVRHAVALVGPVKIHNLVLGRSVTRRWSQGRTPGNWDGEKFNLHSLSVAILSDMMALRAAVPHAECAFTAGLLHDIGKLLIAVTSPAEFKRIHSIYSTGYPSDPNCEADVIGVTHAEISGALAERWRLPAPIREAVSYHHSPDSADEGRLHLAHVVETANHFVNSRGLGMPPYRHHPVVSFEERVNQFGLKECALDLAQAFEKEIEAVRTLF